MVSNTYRIEEDPRDESWCNWVVIYDGDHDEVCRIPSYLGENAVEEAKKQANRIIRALKLLDKSKECDEASSLLFL